MDGLKVSASIPHQQYYTTNLVLQLYNFLHLPLLALQCCVLLLQLSHTLLQSLHFPVILVTPSLQVLEVPLKCLNHSEQVFLLIFLSNLFSFNCLQLSPKFLHNKCE